MARYDVFRRPGSDVYLLDVQNDLIDHLRTRVVAPLLPLSSSPPPVWKLNPVFEIDGQKYVMATHLLATLPMLELGE